MAGQRTGTPTIWKLSRKITQVYGKYGASDLADKLSPAMAACIVDLVACVTAHLLTDDYVLMADNTEPHGPEDPL